MVKLDFTITTIYEKAVLNSGPTMDKRRNKDPFITRLVKSLVKLERKYAIPPHKRKVRMFTIIPKVHTKGPVVTY